MNYRKYNLKKRIISILLTLVMIMGTYVCDYDLKTVHASSGNAWGLVDDEDPDIIYLSSSDGQPAEFIVDIAAGNRMEYYTAEGLQVTTPGYHQLVITDPQVLVKVTNGNYSGGTLEILNEYGGTIWIDDAITVDGNVAFYDSTIEFLGGDAYITGTVPWFIRVTSGDVTIQSTGRLTDDFDVSGGTLTNYGTVAWTSIDRDDLDGLTSTDSAVYEVSNNFECDINLLGTVKVQNDTHLELTGGKCKVELPNGISKTFEASFANSVTGTAYDLIMVDPEITLAAVDDIYLGTEPDFSDKVSVAAGYDKENVYFEYAMAGSSEFSSDLPNSIGNWKVRAVAPEDGEYMYKESAERNFRVSFLPLTSVTKADGDSYLKVSGLTNGKYTQDSVTVSPASDFQVKTYMGGSEFADSQTLTYDDLYGYGYFNTDYGFYFKRKSDGAETDYVYIGSTGAGLDEIIFDLEDPKYINVMLEDENGAQMETNLEDNDHFIGAQLTFKVYDENLAKIVTPDGTSIEGVDFDGDTQNFAFAAEWGNAQHVTMTATDYSGRSSEVSFVLKYPLVSTTASVTANDIYVGDEPDLTVDTLSDGKADATFEYKLSTAPDTAYSTDIPYEAGSYTVRATVPETDKYEEVSCTDTFDVIKRTPATATVTVPNTKVGEEYSPEITSDSDGVEEADVMYKLKTAPEDDYNSVMPEEAGEYDVRASIPETDEYLGIDCYGSFTISKHSADDSKVDIPDMNIGTEYEPVLTTSSDGVEEVLYAYKKSTDNDSAYTDVKPAAAGTYTVRATIPETYMYEEVVVTDNFTIKKLIPSVSVIVPDSKVGDSYSPSAATTSDGVVSYQYKKVDEADTAYSSVKPTAGGTYVVKATVAETDTYSSAAATAEFTISRLTPSSAKVTVADSIIGDPYDPIITTDSDGKNSVVYEYKPIDGEDSLYTTVKPAAAGEYTVRATVPETDYYGKIVCTCNFKILKKTPSYMEVSVADVREGTELSPVLRTDSDGINLAEYFYKPADAPDEAYSNVMPSLKGKYSVKAVVPETDTFSGASCESTFNILIFKRKVESIKVSVSDTVVGTEYEPVLETDSDGKADAVFEYKSYGSDDETYSRVKPEAAGTYMVRATVPETDEFESASAESSFSINKREVTKAILNQKNAYVGQPLYPILETDSDGRDIAGYLYKPFDADDSAYSAYVPILPGRYTVKAVIPETSVYKASSCTDNFTLSYLDAPDEVFTIQGKEGKNKFYISDVYLKAPVEYLISAEYGGEYTDSILYSSSIKNVYLVRKSDGARTGAIAISGEYKIDKEMPKFIGKTEPLSGSNTFFSDAFKLSVSDENLAKILLDGLEMDTNDSKADIVLDPANGAKKFSITAEDAAGNTSTVDITVKAEWLKTKIIPADKVLPLEDKESYKLDSGSWTVSGDNTVYNGGVSVYVNESGEYVFTRVD